MLCHISFVFFSKKRLYKFVSFISEYDKNLRNLLKNGALREQLVKVDKSKGVKVAMKEAMQDPLFVEFANQCLSIVDPENYNKL